MDWTNELGKRFGGFWNALFLIVVLVICLRFAGAEWKASALGIRLLYGLYLVLGVFIAGVIFALVKVGLTKFNPSRYSTTSAVPADVAWGLKYGITAGALVVFVIGLLMVDNYLGPLKEVIDFVINKIGEKLP